MPRSSSNRPLSASSPCSAAAVTHPTCRRQPARTQPDRTPDSRQVPRPRNAEGVAWRARSASTPAWLRRPLEEPEEGLPFISGREPPRAADCTVSRRRPRRETEKRGCLCAKPRHEEAQSQRRAHTWRGDAAGASELRARRAVSTPGSASTCCFATGRQNTGDKLRSGARVLPRRRGHEAACPCWQPCRRKLRQLHPLVRRPRAQSLLSQRPTPDRRVLCCKHA